MDDRRPVVGVVGHGYVVPRAFGDLPVTGTPPTYLDCLTAAGARPVVLPGEHAVDLLDLVDAVVLTGGGDLDPALSGARNARTDEVDRARDEAELALARAAAQRRTPVLGICRGMQVLVVADGGTLHDGVGHVHLGPGHLVRTAAGSQARALLGTEVVTTALHQQAVADPGPCWRATAWADAVVEAVEPVDPARIALGVQWHPELHGTAPFHDPTGPALFGWLADRAREHRALRSPDPLPVR
ncbi:MAG: gamma-glutamyl-gamma-aminobutyrate hydrolase family protein [Microbacterium sp.]|nr:MAG: gamma-glutamyl-gamma-aminobutyrate hydrolase family protein [Microbacterium sp.]